jgi:hypothetical protein
MMFSLCVRTARIVHALISRLSSFSNSQRRLHGTTLLPLRVKTRLLSMCCRYNSRHREGNPESGSISEGRWFQAPPTGFGWQTWTVRLYPRGPHLSGLYCSRYWSKELIPTNSLGNPGHRRNPSGSEKIDVNDLCESLGRPCLPIGSLLELVASEVKLSLT